MLVHRCDTRGPPRDQAVRLDLFPAPMRSCNHIGERLIGDKDLCAPGCTHTGTFVKQGVCGLTRAEVRRLQWNEHGSRSD